MRSTKQVKYVDLAAQPIVLIGFMSCGKSTLGRMLAAHLKLRFTDLDQCIIKQAGRRIADIFAREGEEGFRAREARALKATLKPGKVISLGGGTVMKPSNRALIKRSGAVVVWINPPWSAIWRRLSKLDPKKRPLLWDSESERPRGETQIKKLWQARRTAYKNAAHVALTVSGGESETETLERLINILRPIVLNAK